MSVKNYIFSHQIKKEVINVDESLKILADYDFHLMLYKKKTTYKKLDVTIAHCRAQGLSKNFSWALYAEEMRMKRKRLSTGEWLMNLPVIFSKFIYKKLR